MFEVDSNGTEFYIVLNGQADFYVKGNKDSDSTKVIQERIKNEKSIEIPRSSTRHRSAYEGKR